MVYSAEKVECPLNCPNCGKEILDEDATFCPKCGNTLETQSKGSDLVLAAAILTIIGAAFSAGLGYIAIYRYNYLVFTYFPSQGIPVPPEVLGFLIFGIPSIIASAFAIAGATFMLKRKFITLSMLGIILQLVSVVVTYITIYQNNLLDPITALGFTGTLLLSQISIIIFSILSTILVYKSRDEFA